MSSNFPAGFRQGPAGLAVPIDVKSAQFGLYNTPRSTGQIDWYRPRWFATGDIRKLVTEYDRWELMNFSRQLFAGLGNYNAAILQKAYRAVGEEWHAQYFGEDAKWGQEVEEWLQFVFYPNCDLRGEPYDFVTDLSLTAISMHVDGDDAMLLTEDVDTHFPKLQFIPSHRINTRMRTTNKADKITSGWASGATISQGIIYDRNMKVVGIRVLGDGDIQDTDIPMSGCQMMYDPVWQSQNRGIPPVSSEVMGGLDLQDIDVYLKRIVKRASSIGLLRYTENGQADTGEAFVTDTPLQDGSPGIKRELSRGGEDYYFTAGKNEKIAALEAKVPTDNIENFIKRLEHRFILAAGWHSELLNPKELGGATVRLIQDNARALIRHLQKSLRVRALRAIRYAVPKAAKHGFISPCPSDWWKWDFEMPALITVDQGHEATADLNMLKLGAMTEEKYHAKFGDSAKQVRIQKLAEVRDRIEAAQDLATKTGKDFFWCYEQLWNPSAVQQSGGPMGNQQAGGGGGGGGGGSDSDTNPDKTQ